jgi:hypothetical protein
LSCHLEVFETQIDKEYDADTNAIFMVVLQVAPLSQSLGYSMIGGIKLHSPTISFSGFNGNINALQNGQKTALTSVVY